MRQRGSRHPVPKGPDHALGLVRPAAVPGVLCQPHQVQGRDAVARSHGAIEGWPGPEVGWTISPLHLRRGYAEEAGRASIDFAFDTLGWDQVIHVIMDGNEPSIRLAEKLGSTYLRTQQGLPGVTEETVHVYGQSRKP